MKLVRTCEWKTNLLVPDLSQFSHLNFPAMGPAVFYNPKMEFCRTVSVCALRAFVREAKNPSVCDALAASGVRGLRYANEAGCRVTLNDHNPKAAELALKNAKALGIDAEITQMDANVLLSGRRFDVVDLDPFGTPSPFLDSAARSAKKFLLVTATDTAVLCGVQPKAARRLYGAKTWRGDCVHEAALRILLAKIANVLAVHEKAMEPVLAQSTEHYLRVFVRVSEGATKADNCLAQLGPLYSCPHCHEHNLDGRKHCGKPYGEYGPVWTGSLFDKKFCRAAAAEARDYDERVQKFFGLVLGEADAPPLYYDLHRVASWSGVSAPKADALLASLKKKGITATKTHMASPALRVDCSLAELKAALKGL